MEEIWVDIKGYNGKYQVSNLGRVKSFSKYSRNGIGSIIKGGETLPNPQSYKYVCLLDDKSHKKNHYIHKLVAEHFCENPYNYTEVNHIDGNAHNNRAENLEWCTHKQNMEHASRTGVLARGQKQSYDNPNSKPVIQCDMDGNFIREWGSVNEAGRVTGIPKYSIFKCLNPHHQQKSSYGYKWKYKTNKKNRATEPIT